MSASLLSALTFQRPPVLTVAGRGSIFHLFLRAATTVEAIADEAHSTLPSTVRRVLLAEDEVLVNSRQAHPALPVVFSSGHGDGRTLEAQLATPRTTSLLKPYRLEQLPDTIASVAAEQTEDRP